MFTFTARCALALSALTIATVAGEFEPARRVAEVSAAYLGRPYVLGPLGEGEEGAISTKPLSDESRFDCTTYVETVLARAYAKTQDDYACVLRNIRYLDGEAYFLSRAHLPDSEWIPHQIELGILRDVTNQIADGLWTKQVRATVNRGDWLRRLGPGDVKKNVPPAEKKELADVLHQRAADYGPAEVNLAYLPLDALARADVLTQIPSGAVVNVVRRSPRWIVRGRAVRIEAVVSHQGFLILKNDQVFVRSATTLTNPRVPGDSGGKVRDIRLDDYVNFLKSIKDPRTGEANVVGLNILLPQDRPAGLCR